MKLIVEIEPEDDGRWLAEIGVFPGVLAYGVSSVEAMVNAKALALRVIADRFEHGEQDPQLLKYNICGGSGTSHHGTF